MLETTTKDKTKKKVAKLYTLDELIAKHGFPFIATKAKASGLSNINHEIPVGSVVFFIGLKNAGLYFAYNKLSVDGKEKPHAIYPKGRQVRCWKG